MSPGVLTGLMALKNRGFAELRGLRIGLLANPTAVDADFVHLLDLLADCGVRVEVLFGPEHGFHCTVQDMVGVGEARHAVRIVSLYGDTFESLRPAEADLRPLDALVFDIQDIGSRYYTYVWTLALTMEVAARTGTRIIVLDRPNPITGSHVEGGSLDVPLRSFVGLHEIPNRHGMTAGEIATLVALLLDIPKPEIVRMEGYRRSMWHDETGAPWVMPSPNMPTPETALVYPGQCLLEGTNLSEGRGTTRPFEIFGAPFMNGRRLAEALAAEALPGACFRPLQFQPTFHKWAGRECGGLQIHVTDREAFLPYRTSLAILRHTRALWPREFAWRVEPYEFRGDVPAVDLLTGSPRVREMIDAGAPVVELAEFVETSGRAARENRCQALLYES